MTDFDDIADLWRQQRVQGGAASAAAVMATVRRHAEQRRRHFVWPVILCALALLLFQVCSLANALAQPSGVLSPRFIAHQLTALMLLIFVVRRTHTRQVRVRYAGDCIRANLLSSLDALEAEMSDLRFAVWIGPWVLLLPQVLLRDLGTMPPLALGSLGLCAGLLGVTGWFHYHRVLAPRRCELVTVLAQLSAGA